MTIYLLTKRGTLHRAVQDVSGQKMSYEGDNLDVAEVDVFGELIDVPAERIKRFCRRCFPERV